MSDFTCRCGELMARVKGRLTCTACGGHEVHGEDGMSGPSASREYYDGVNSSDDDDSEGYDDYGEG